MEKKFIYTKKEFVSGFRKILVETNELSRVDFLVFPFLLLSSYFVKIFWISLVLGIIGFIGLVALFISYIVMPRRFFRDNEYYRGEYFVEITLNDFFLQNDNTVIEKEWDEFENVIIDDKFLYLYLEESAVFIPLRVFSEKEFEKVLNILKDWRTE